MAVAPTSRGDRPAFAAEAFLRALAGLGADFPPAVEAFGRAKKTHAGTPY